MVSVVQIWVIYNNNNNNNNNNSNIFLIIIITTLLSSNSYLRVQVTPIITIHNYTTVLTIKILFTINLLEKKEKKN